MNAAARAIVDANLYLVLATADDTGRPWPTPVYFAHAAYRQLLWVSSPEATHSRNIANNPQVGIVVFDSQAAIRTGQGVYLTASAELVGSDDLSSAIETFSHRSVSHGGAAWTVDDVQPGSGLRLYRADVESVSMLAKDGGPDHRVPAEEEPGEPLATTR